MKRKTVGSKEHGVQRFKELHGGKHPQEYSYFGFEQYRKLYIFGKTQEDVYHFIKCAKIAKKHSLILIIMIFCVYIPSVIFGSVLGYLDILLLGIFCSIVHLCVSLSLWIKYQKHRKHTKSPDMYDVIDIYDKAKK